MGNYVEAVAEFHFDNKSVKMEYDGSGRYFLFNCEHQFIETITKLAEQLSANGTVLLYHNFSDSYHDEHIEKYNVFKDNKLIKYFTHHIPYDDDDKSFIEAWSLDNSQKFRGFISRNEVQIPQWWDNVQTNPTHTGFLYRNVEPTFKEKVEFSASGFTEDTFSDFFNRIVEIHTVDDWSNIDGFSFKESQNQ